MNLRIFFACLIWCVCVSGLSAQVETRVPTPGNEVPEFFLDALSFESADSVHSRVDVYLHVPYEALRFVAGNGVYKAQYEATVNISADDNASIAEKTWTEDITHARYEETESRTAYNLTQRSFDISPGTYKLRAQIRDMESKKSAVITRKIVVGSYTGPGMSMSDIMLISRVTTDKGRLNIVPNITGNVADVVNGLYVFYEVYNNGGGDSVESTYMISKPKKELNADVFGQRVLHRLSGNRTQIIEKLDTARYSIGTYVLTIELKPMNVPAGASTATVEKQKAFIARWGAVPYSVTDLDLAIRQLRYIAKDNEYSQMMDAKTTEEKQRLFQEFWKRRDPSPDTKRNEYMDEYYSRVEYANEHFSHYLAGWRTDMGMVFILLGSPNNVERHPFDIDSKPYEVWSYYDYNRQVVFVDDTGFGDFKLMTPIYDLLQRAKQ
ncbi:MAG TPA: GWxTD domain-containing protein [Bacteroidota bacterium]|nr:GWxTD domain-containing protein [Bacteroidota bacterium]